MSSLIWSTSPTTMPSGHGAQLSPDELVCGIRPGWIVVKWLLLLQYFWEITQVSSVDPEWRWRIFEQLIIKMAMFWRINSFASSVIIIAYSISIFWHHEFVLLLLQLLLFLLWLLLLLSPSYLLYPINILQWPSFGIHRTKVSSLNHKTVMTSLSAQCQISIIHVNDTRKRSGRN